MKHGGYSAIYWDTLTDEERQLIETAPQSEEDRLENRLKLFDVRERRILTAINEQRAVNGGMTTTTVSTTSREDADGNSDGNIITHTTSEAAINTILRLENELTRVQRAKTQCIESFNKIRANKAETKGNSLAEEWIEAVIGGEDGTSK